MTLEEIKQLIDLTNQSGIAELEVERGGNRVRIRRTLQSAQQQEIVLHPTYSMQPGAGSPGDTPAGPSVPAPESNLQLVKAPIVGTFYECPKPGSPAGFSRS